MADNKKATFLLEFKEKGIKIIEQTVKELEALGIDSNEASAKIDSLVDSMSALATESKDTAKQVNKVDDAIDETSKTAKTGESRIKKFFGALKSGASQGTTAGIDKTSNSIKTLVKYAAAYLTIQKTIEYTSQLATELDKVAIMADRAGVEFNKFNALSMVAKRFDINVEMLSDKFVDLNEYISEAANEGGGIAVDLFKQLNLNAKEMIKLKPDEQLEKLAKSLAGLSKNQQRQIIAAFNLDDLIPLLNNYNQVIAQQERLAKAGLNVDPTVIKQTMDQLSTFKNDFTAFNQVVLTEFLGELNKMYDLEPGENSFLNGENAKEFAKNLASVVKLFEVLGRTLLIVAETADFVATALLAIPQVGKSALYAVSNSVNKIADKIKESDFESLRIQYQDDPEALKQIEEAYKKFQENVYNRNEFYNKKAANGVKNIGVRLAKELSDIGEATDKMQDSLVNKYANNSVPLSIDIEKPEDTDYIKAQEEIAAWKKKVTDLNSKIDILEIDMQINDELTPKNTKEITSLLKERNDYIDKLQTKYPSAGFAFIDVKQGQLDITNAEKNLESFYDKQEADRKKRIDEATKYFNDQIEATKFEFNFGIIDSNQAVKNIAAVYDSFEKFMETNGTYLENLKVQEDRINNIKEIRKQDLELENLRIQLLKAEGKEVAAIEIQRARALANIKESIKSIEQQAKLSDITNKIFDLQTLQAQLSEVENNIKNLETKLGNTDFFNTEERLKLEKEITIEKTKQATTQAALGIETEKANANAILTVRQVKELDKILENSVLDNFSDFIAGTKSAKEAFNEFATDFLKNLSKMILQQLYLNALQSVGMGGNNGGIASFLFGSIPSFHTGIGSGSTSSFQPTVQVPGVTKDDEGLAILRRGEKVVTQNQEYNKQFQNSSSTTNNNLYLDSQQLSNAALNNSTGEELVMKIITKNRNTIKNM